MRRGAREPIQDDGWDSEISSGLALAAFLSLVFVAVTLLAIGPMSRFDTYFNLAPAPESWRPTLQVVDRIGQRAVCLPILAVVTYLLCRRQESWRPAVVAFTAVFFLNLIVLVLKMGLARGAPQAVDPSFFGGGMAYPSGHSANIVLVYGLVAYLLMAYGDPGRWLRAALWALVPLLSVVMVLTSLLLNWHWFTDLLAGLLVGAVILQVTVTVNRAVPAAGFVAGWRQGLRDLVTVLRRGRSRGPANPV